MSLFLSTFTNKIDKKGRVSVPATFRATLALQAFSGIVVFRSLKHPALEGCGMDRMEQLSQSIDHLDLFSDTQDDLVSSIFADSHMLPFDGEGRISIPEDFMTFADLVDQVAFVGRGATFQLWRPDIFKDIQNDARARLKAQGLSLKLTPNAPATGESTP